MKKQQLSSLSAAIVAAICLAGAATSSVAAEVAGLYAYPRSGQDQNQQSRDEFDCSQWAQQQTGFNPYQTPPPASTAYAPPPPPPPPPQQQSKGVLGIGSRDYKDGGLIQDGAIGAGLGAVGGAIAGDAGQGAALGAVASVLFGGVQRLSQNDSDTTNQQQYYQQQQQAQYQQQQPPPDVQYNQHLDNFRRAYGACMGGRGYEVR
jgi:hypothetical protein